MTDNKPMEVLKKQLMNYLIERKCAKNNQDNYRYALNGMIDYCNGKPITNNNLNANFRKFLFQAGISYGGRGKGPRIYDFRHTFAVNCLKNLVQRGADMNTYYPILKTYMGHSFFKYTEYYLRLTKNMYPDIGEKLNATLGSVIPEVWGDECE